MKEQELVEETRQKLRMILKTRKDIVMLACQQRSKFEGWLKFELAGALNRDLDIQNVIFEGDIPMEKGPISLSVIAVLPVLWR